MIFPSIEEYKDALRIAGHSLKTLHDYEPVLRDDGDLWFSSGNFAVVFKVRHRTSGRLLALKCFTRHQENRAESYRLITECLKDYPSDYLVRYEYHDEELWVNSRMAGERDFPVLAMDWAEGVTLGEFVRNCCARDDRAVLQNLIAEFNWFAFWLLSQPFAHGDLKPDNIVMRPDGKPVLLDYDGMYVPAMKGQPARELGSPVYRHPGRTVDVFDKRIDDFGLLVLMLELRILAAAPAKHTGRVGSESLWFHAMGFVEITTLSGLLNTSPASGQLLRHFEQQALAGERSDLTALVFGMVKGEELPVLAEPPRVALLTKQFDWEPEMVFVKGGAFMMGCTREQQDCNDNEKPAHAVTLNDFYIGGYEVTQRLWKLVMGTAPSSFKNRDDCPVESVSWDNVQAFIQKLNAQTSRTYRLPTEAEWEYAARGGGKQVLFGNGKNVADPNEINFDADWIAHGWTVPVGSLNCPNELGLHDMSGNVWEWCSDWYDSNYYKNSPSFSPTGPSSGSYRVLRGGSWYSAQQYCRVTVRSYGAPDFRSGSTGFRLAMTF